MEVAKTSGIRPLRIDARVDAHPAKVAWGVEEAQMQARLALDVVEQCVSAAEQGCCDRAQGAESTESTAAEVEALQVVRTMAEATARLKYLLRIVTEPDSQGTLEPP